MSEGQLDWACKVMFDADRECRKACDRLLWPRGLDEQVDKSKRAEFRSELHRRIGILERAYCRFFEAVCDAQLPVAERQSCLDDLKFRHAQQLKSLSHISARRSRLRPLAEILSSCSKTHARIADSLCESIPIAAAYGFGRGRLMKARRRKRQDRFEMQVSSLFADLNIEKLEENEETGDLIDWLRRALREEEEEQVSGPTDERTSSRGAPE